MPRIVPILTGLTALAACVLTGCGDAEPTTVPGPPADPLPPVAREVVPPSPIAGPTSEAALVVSSFGFLYAGEGAVLDALDIDAQASAADQEPADDACAHDDFTDPEGQAGVDHQFLRVTETFGSLQAGGIADIIIGSAVKNGSMTVMVVVAEDAVRVVMGQDAPLTGNDGEVLPSGSFRPYLDRAYHADLGPPVVTDGVLLAGPADVRLKMNIQIVETDLLIRDAYLRLTMGPDGTATGVLQGYWDSAGIIDVLASTEAHLMALGYSLEEFAAALDANADRDPDADGVCQALSAAFRFDAVPAFLVADEEAP